MGNRAEINRLRLVEFPSRAEALLRFSAIFSGGVILNYFWQWHAVWFWLAGYFGVMAVYWRFLSSRPPAPSNRDVTVAHGLFLLLLVAFIWLPIRAMMEPSVPIAFTSTAAYACLLVFLIWRGESALTIIWGTVATLFCAHVALLVHYLPLAQATSQQVIMAVAGLASIGYLAQAMLTQRARARETMQSLRRNAEAQRLEAIGQVAGGIAHQFNNSLTAIQGNLELAALSSDDAERQELLGEAHAAALRSAELVRQLLAYTRSARMTRARIVLRRAMDQVATGARAVLPSSITLVIEPPPADLTVVTDESQLVAVLLQLIANARDAMPNGGRITLRSRTVADLRSHLMPDGSFLPPGAYVAIEVCDSGTGIPRDLIGRVTDPFFSTKPVGIGSGMGLAVATGFARQSGGGMTIASSAKGTVITLILPAATVDSDLPQVPPARTASRVTR
ncbi:sensor histidine kinase [Seohaeicola nanhaiensis]|uniref:histidine kinase n=1 Tax=Seohaeicola nanhaiensis TaxID=1387282 RepID=A0ABV9KK05_9RHOB